MADYTFHRMVSERMAWKLPNPTNLTEVGKVKSHIYNYLEEENIKYYDDTVTVTATDDEIEFSIVTKKWSAV